MYLSVGLAIVALPIYLLISQLRGFYADAAARKVKREADARVQLERQAAALETIVRNRRVQQFVSPFDYLDADIQRYRSDLEAEMRNLERDLQMLEPESTFTTTVRTRVERPPANVPIPKIKKEPPAPKALSRTRLSMLNDDDEWDS